MALFTPEVTWHEYSNGIGSEFFVSPPDVLVWIEVDVLGLDDTVTWRYKSIFEHFGWIENYQLRRPIQYTNAYFCICILMQKRN